MADPYDANVDAPVLLSSDSTCAPHTIRWESSISGHITTREDAGSLPIKGVVINYQIYSENYARLDCDNCSGSAMTNEGGGFTIDFNLDHPFLHDMGETDDIPVLVPLNTRLGHHVSRVYLP